MPLLDKNSRKNVLFNGCDLNTMYGLYILDIQQTQESQFGVKRNVTFVDNNFVKTNEERFSLDITFARVSNDKVLELTDTLLQDLNRVFFSNKEISNMMIGYKTYYVIPVQGSIRKLKNGYFTITFESASPYAYSNIYAGTYRVLTTKDIELKNLGVTNIYADVELKAVTGDAIVTIKNNTTGKSITINNVSNINSIKIYGDSSEVEGTSYNNIVGSIQDALELWTGTNRYTITSTAEINIIFKHQCELGLM